MTDYKNGIDNGLVFDTGGGARHIGDVLVDRTRPQSEGLDILWHRDVHEN